MCEEAPMLQLNEILTLIETNRGALNEMGVHELAVFGSAARGEASSDSDIDVLVDLEVDSFDAYMDIKFFLEDLLHAPVDLVLKGTVKPELKASIEKTAVHAPGL